jgi:pimeloyl-ACP methyl ester carboxylesterase
VLNTRRAITRKPLRHLTTMAGLRRAGPPLHGIWGAHDAISSWKIDGIKADFQAVDPTSQFRIIEGAGHWVMYEAADAFNRALVNVLTG